jgi:hypothetical protein
MWQIIHLYQYLENPWKYHLKNSSNSWNYYKHPKCWSSNWPIQNPMWAIHVNTTNYRIHHHVLNQSSYHHNPKKTKVNISIHYPNETKNIKIKSGLWNLKESDKYHLYIPPCQLKGEKSQNLWIKIINIPLENWKG